MFADDDTVMIDTDYRSLEVMTNWFISNKLTVNVDF